MSQQTRIEKRNSEVGNNNVPHVIHVMKTNGDGGLIKFRRDLKCKCHKQQGAFPITFGDEEYNLCLSTISTHCFVDEVRVLK